ncbi:MAG: hypothetical protein AAF585_21910 [Verrucomicrobiota bacterium]
MITKSPILLICATFMAFLCAGFAQNSAKDLENQYMEAKQIADEPIHNLEKSYVGALTKLKEMVQGEGNLERALKVEEEIKGYAETKKREFEDFPELRKRREIYETSLRRLEADVRGRNQRLLQSYRDRANKLKTELTQKGELESAKAVAALEQTWGEELSKLSGAQPASDSGLLWKLESQDDFELVHDCEAEERSGVWQLKSRHQHSSYLQTNKSFETPVKISMKAGTDTVGLRIYFGKAQLAIFNWQSNPKELRVASPAGGRAVGFPDQGLLEKSKLHEIEIELERKKIKVSVDGRERAELDTDLAGLEGTVGIGPAFGSVISVENFEVSQD